MAPSLSLALGMAGVVALAAAAKFPNMNGDYVISKTPGATGDFPTNFADFPGGVEYFDVYHGPIKSNYSQVWWTSTQNDIPKEIVERFDGKVMAIVGIEMDQVMNTSEGYVSVPITYAYNHHHDTAVYGSKHAHMEKVDMNDPRRVKAGRAFVRLDMNKAWLPIEDKPTLSGAPSSAMFSDGNGGEYRKSFHALAPPFAQLVESPSHLAGSPMQIDTWNRDKMQLPTVNHTGSPFVPGPYSKHVLAPASGPDAIYSGLLECPLTTRIEKVLKGGSKGFNFSYETEIFDQCNSTKPEMCTHAVNTSTSCFAAIKEMAGLSNISVTTKTVSDLTLPSGCSVSVQDGKATVVFNSAESKVCCDGGKTSSITGQQSSLVTLGLEVSAASDTVTITMTGPSTVWFGVGLDASLMANEPYTIVVDGNGNVTERKLQDHAAGTQLATSVKLASNTVANGMRTVVVTRGLKGVSKDHYTFSATTLTLPFINAVGSSGTFGYHKASAASSIGLFPKDGSPACICGQPPAPFGQGEGVIKYLPTGQTIGFANVCPPQPRGDLLAQKNPTCDIRTYTGGLNTCHHGWYLLDADQEIPWTDQELVYYKKFRIYFQEYNESFHKQIFRHDWGIGADHDYAEYDVPQCAAGTPTEECNHTITGTWIPVPASNKNVHLVAAHFHCHAPTCLKMELWNNDTGKLMCRQEPIYGGTGKIDKPTFDEPGYIAQPPCLWGSPEHGLEAPPLMSGVTIKVVSVTNSTYGHHGEMALPEMSLVTLD